MPLSQRKTELALRWYKNTTNPNTSPNYSTQPQKKYNTSSTNTNNKLNPRKHKIPL